MPSSAMPVCTVGAASARGEPARAKAAKRSATASDSAAERGEGRGTRSILPRVPDRSAVEVRRGRLALGRGVALGDLVPVDDVPPGLEVLGPAVVVLEVVRVLPDVVAQQRRVAVEHRAVLVGRLGELELAAGEPQPRPARAELPDAI